MAETALHENLFAVATAFWASRSLHAIAELGVGDVLGESPQTVVHLAQATGNHPIALDRVLRLLAGHGIFEFRDGVWMHTAASRLLRDDHPQSARAYLRLMALPFVWQSWAHMEHALRTGEPGLTRLDAEGAFAYLAKHPEESRVFNAAMAAKAQREIPPVLAAYDFSRFKRIADIGGGHGHLLRSILKNTPTASGVVFDQPHVIAEAPQTEKPVGATGRRFLSGSAARRRCISIDGSTPRLEGCGCCSNPGRHSPSCTFQRDSSGHRNGNPGHSRPTPRQSARHQYARDDRWTRTHGSGTPGAPGLRGFPAGTSDPDR